MNHFDELSCVNQSIPTAVQQFFHGSSAIGQKKQRRALIYLYTVQDTRHSSSSSGARKPVSCITAHYRLPITRSSLYVASHAPNSIPALSLSLSLSSNRSIGSLCAGSDGRQVQRHIVQTLPYTRVWAARYSIFTENPVVEW